MAFRTNRSFCLCVMLLNRERNEYVKIKADDCILIVCYFLFCAVKYIDAIYSCSYVLVVIWRA